jgi:glycosyltransferase involved in cell wall biosynthesis
MRILTVCSSWRVFGAETITLKMLEGFQHAGLEQVAVTSIWTDGDFSRRLQQIGIREVAMPFGAITARLTPRYIKWTVHCFSQLPVLWWRWWRLQRQFRPDVILWTSSKQALLVLPRLGRTPSFLIEFTHVVPTRNMRWLYRNLAMKLTGFVAVSDYMRGHLHGVGAPFEKIHVVKSGAFFERERESSKPMWRNSNPRAGLPARVGIVGQVAPNKGHDCLVEAVRLLRARGVQLTVQVFGSGDPAYESRLKELVRAAGMDPAWQWMGYQREKAKIFEQLDICVVPSCFGDPFPTVAMEAGVYGLPVVASRVGGLPEIVEDGVTGWLFEANAPGQLAEKIEWLIRYPERAREMGVAGRERVFRYFTVEKMVAEFEALFQEFAQRS